MQEEFFPVVDENGNVIGKESREQCHAKTFILHPVVHLHVFNSKGDLYLQKRSDLKDIQPGKWDTSVGGHIRYGESVEKALLREAGEELSLKGFEPKFLMRYIHQSSIEREMINVYYTVFDGVIEPDHDEVSEGRFWSILEIESNIGKGVFTPNFEKEFLKVKKALGI